MSRRDDVLAALGRAQTFVGAQELYTRLRADGSPIGLATVYRTLAALEADGTVDAMRPGDGETLYRVCASAEHHHHLRCRGCGQVIELDAAAVEDWTRTVARRHGFDLLEHTVEISGRCEGCRARQGTDGPGERAAG